MMRCAMDSSSCEFFSEIVQEDLCPTFEDPTFLQSLVSGGDNKIDCPIKTVKPLIWYYEKKNIPDCAQQSFFVGILPIHEQHLEH